MTDIPTPQGASDGQFTYGVDADGTLLRRKVGIEEINYDGRFGATEYSGSSITIGIGTHYFVLDTDNENFRVGDDVLITSMVDNICYMWGEIIGSDTVDTPRRLMIYVDDISNAVGIYAAWRIQVVARPKPGIEKDTSTTSVNPTTGGPWTFTVTAGKFFPIGGTLLIKPTTDRTIALIGEVSAYSGTSLTVTLRATNATVSQAYTSWSIALLDSPPQKIPYFQINGLSVEVSYTNPVLYVLVNPGSVIDSTETLELQLDAVTQKGTHATFLAGFQEGGVVVSSALAGTISSVGTAVTGSGTSFLSSFGEEALTDYKNANPADTLVDSIISTASVTDGIASIGGNTALTTNIALGAAGAAYYRGGVLTTTGSIVPYFVVLIRRDSDGYIDVCLSAATDSGEPDLPSGYTYYRVLALVTVTWSTVYPNATYTIIQPLAEMQITDNAVTNAKLANMAAYTLKGRNAGTTGDPSDIDITALTAQSAPTTADFLLGVDTAASNAFKKYGATVIAREKLTANRTYYVRTDGSNSNTGLVDSAGGAFLTLQKAYDTLITLDLAGYTVTVDVGDGTYTGSLSITKPWVGGTVTFQGDTTTPSNVFINTSGTCVTVSATLPSILTFTGFKFASSADCGLTHTGFGNVYLTKVDFGACVLKINADGIGAFVFVNGNYTDSGNAVRHHSANHGAFIKVSSVTVTTTAAPVYSGNYAWASAHGKVESTATYAYPTITVTIASPGVVTYTAHGMLANAPLSFATTGALPTGLVAGTTYYVKTVVSVDTFTVSATAGGAAINTSGSQSGTHSIRATGSRYNSEYGAFIYTVGAGTSYFPGNAAGTGTNFGASPYGMYA